MTSYGLLNRDWISLGYVFKSDSQVPPATVGGPIMLLRYKGALLSWLTISVSVGVFFWFLIGLLALWYGPEAPGAHLIPVRVAFAAIGVLACSILAIHHSRMKRRTLVLHNALELVAVPIFLWIGFQIIAANYQQPDHLRLTYRAIHIASPVFIHRISRQRALRMITSTWQSAGRPATRSTPPPAPPPAMSHSAPDRCPLG